MSIIIDALKKAQEERKKAVGATAPGMGSGPKGEKKNQKFLFYGVVAFLVCLILVFAFYPTGKKTRSAQAPAKPLSAGSVKPAASPVPAEKPDAPAPETATTSWEAETTAAAPTLAKAVPAHKSPPSPTAFKTTTAQGARDINADKPMQKKQVTTKKTINAKVPAHLHALPAPQPTPQERNIPVVIKKVDEERLIALFNDAAEEMKGGNIDRAKDIYRTILKEKPDYLEALNNLGVIAMEEGDGKEARSCFTRCLEYKKDYGNAYNNLGLMMMKEGNDPAAEKHFKKAIELDRGKVEPYLNLSAIMRRGGRHKEAATLLESAIKRHIQDPALYLSMAIIKDEAKQRDDAIRYYRYYLGASGAGDLDREVRGKIIDRLHILEESKPPKNY